MTCQVCDKTLSLNNASGFCAKHGHLNPSVRVYRLARRPLYNAKRRARNENVPFELTFEKLPVIPDNCPICNRHMSANENMPGDDSPSLDRLAPKLGYVLDNISWICYRCNWVKGNGTSEEHELIANWMRRQETDKSDESF